MPHDTLAAPLSVDQAAALLNAPEPDEERRDAIPAEAPVAGDAGEGPSDAVPGDGEEELAADASQDAIEPPRWWSRDAKARFAELPPDVQKIVFAQEDTRERVLSRARQENAEARRLAENQASELGARLNALDTFLPYAAEQFRGKWDGVDWAALPSQIGAEETLKYRAQYEAEQKTLATLAQAKAAHEQERGARFDREEAEKLKTLAPDLADEKSGPLRKARIAQELISKGFPAERIRWMSAEEAAYVNDALKWREAQASAQVRARPTPSAKPVVRPAAAPAIRSTQSSRLRQLASKRTLSIDEAAELLTLKGNQTQ
jgi:hypothetical protein